MAEQSTAWRDRTPAADPASTEPSLFEGCDYMMGPEPYIAALRGRCRHRARQPP
ncbi:MAG: hypothetical protein R2710_30465 [Acidimicrobiales bacterium]